MSDYESESLPPAGGEVEVLAVVTLGAFSSVELGEIDIEPQMKALERIQQQVVTNEDVGLELVDRAHVTRLQAEFKEKYKDHKRELQKAWDERDALKAEVELLHKSNEEYSGAAVQSGMECDRLQSELTKARELNPCNWTDLQVLDFLGVALRNVDLVGEVKLSEIRQGFRYMHDHQSAPADQNYEWEDTFGPDYTGEDAPAAKPCSHVWVSAENRGAGAGEICQACSESRPAAKGGE